VAYPAAIEGRFPAVLARLGGPIGSKKTRRQMELARFFSVWENEKPTGTPNKALYRQAIEKHSTIVPS
jgi:hypothetical protein